MPEPRPSNTNPTFEAGGHPWVGQRLPSPTQGPGPPRVPATLPTGSVILAQPQVATVPESLPRLPLRPDWG